MDRKQSLKCAMYYHIDEIKSITSDRSDDDKVEKEICDYIVKTINVRVIKFASLSKLIKALTFSYNENFERNFLDIFFTTYRTFSTPNEILELICNHYAFLHDKIENEVKNYSRNPQAVDLIKIYNKKKRNLLFALETWLDDYPEDWDEMSLKKILNFLLIFLPNSEMYIKVLGYLASHFNNQLVMQINASKLNKRKKIILFKLYNISPKHFAEQLTILDVELFLNMIPHECLGGIWSKRKEKKIAKTVAATVARFNAVTLRVISTILIQTEIKERVRTLEAWIDVARELQDLKNFSSLKAIVSALQSISIYRLSKTWASLAPEKQSLFTELDKILTGEQIKTAINELNEIHENLDNKLGFIPYLGLFLSDLIMLDAALSDRDENNLINFDKKRKEYGIISQIKNLQMAIKSGTNYIHIIKEEHFNRWFSTLKSYTDCDSYEISCKLEPPKSNSLVRQKKITIEENDVSQDLKISREDNLGRKNSFYIIRVRYEFPGNENRNSNDSDNNNNTNNNNRPNIINKNNFNENENNIEPNAIVKYKSIMLGNNQKTEHVIQNAIVKFGLKGKGFEYTLSQLLPDKELIIPPNANVYYAMNLLHNLNFIIRPKK